MWRMCARPKIQDVCSVSGKPTHLKFTVNQRVCLRSKCYVFYIIQKQCFNTFKLNDGQVIAGCVELSGGTENCDVCGR